MTAHAPTDFTVTGTREALLRTVLEYPFDNTPRSIFADWMEENGRPEKASGTRHHPGRYPTDHFWTCTTKRFLASSAGMFARRPITSVRLTDKRPHSPTVAPTGVWSWLTEHTRRVGGRGTFELPAAIFDRLTSHVYKGQWAAHYFTEAAAAAALSRACVDYGRELAGLRLIDWDTEGQS